jgi:6-phosphofructokinase
VAVLRVIVLFSSGDAPGMNALLRAIVRLGLSRHRADVLGAKDGYAGPVRTARRLETGQSVLASLNNEIDHGTILLQDLQPSIDPERAESAQKLYRLQKDLSKV